MAVKTIDEERGDAEQMDPPLPGVPTNSRGKQPDFAVEQDAFGALTPRALNTQHLRHDLDILTPETTANVLRVTEQTLAYWRNQGTGPVFTKAGKNVFYRRAELRSWLDKNHQSTSTSDKEAA